MSCLWNATTNHGFLQCAVIKPGFSECHNQPWISLLVCDLLVHFMFTCLPVISEWHSPYHCTSKRFMQNYLLPNQLLQIWDPAFWNCGPIMLELWAQHVGIVGTRPSPQLLVAIQLWSWAFAVSPVSLLQMFLISQWFWLCGNWS